MKNLLRFLRFFADAQNDSLFHFTEIVGEGLCALPLLFLNSHRDVGDAIPYDTMNVDVHCRVNSRIARFFRYIAFTAGEIKTQ